MQRGSVVGARGFATHRMMRPPSWNRDRRRARRALVGQLCQGGSPFPFRKFWGSSLAEALCLRRRQRPLPPAVASRITGVVVGGGGTVWWRKKRLLRVPSSAKFLYFVCLRGLLSSWPDWLLSSPLAIFCALRVCCGKVLPFGESAKSPPNSRFLKRFPRAHVHGGWTESSEPQSG